MFRTWAKSTVVMKPETFSLTRHEPMSQQRRHLTNRGTPTAKAAAGSTSFMASLPSMALNRRWKQMQKKYQDDGIGYRWFHESWLNLKKTIDPKINLWLWVFIDGESGASTWLTSGEVQLAIKTQASPAAELLPRAPDHTNRLQNSYAFEPKNWNLNLRSSIITK